VKESSKSRIARRTQDSLQDIIADIQASLGGDLRKFCWMPAERLAEEFVSGERARRQIRLLESGVGSLKGRRVLEIGTGYGMFMVVSSREFGAECFGVEPGGEKYSSADRIARRLLELHGLEPWRVITGAGETLPLRSSSFDVVYSWNVLEHVQDPKTVIEEAVRVLVPGGYLFFVVPNYGSFWEGHYGLLWVPYISHRLARWYVRLYGRDPTYLDSIHFMNFFSLRRCLRGLGDYVEVLDWGGDTFRYRMRALDLGEWAVAGTLKRLVRLAKSLRLNTVIAEALVRCRAHTPLILTARKKE
jgi:SAM-dependent methyltransferase